MMDVEEQFMSTASLLCEPARARMLWSLLDGRSYTASELALAADISATSASNHLSKLLKAEIVKVVAQGRHRYYSFARPDVAYAVESLANLTGGYHKKANDETLLPKTGVRFCRTCYDHLAGYVGVKVSEALVEKGYVRTSCSEYLLTEEGWEWAINLGILKESFRSNRRPLVRKCLDWSERKPHVAGQFGAVLLSKMLDERWFIRVQFSRELIVTPNGKQKLNDLLGLSV